MAWVEVTRANLTDNSSKTYGYVSFDYDNTSTGVNRSCRIRWNYTWGNSLSVNLVNVALNNSTKGTYSVTTSSKDLWTGSVAGGQNVTLSWYCNWYSGGRKDYSATGYLPTGATAPSGLTATLDSVQDTGATISVNLTSYGTPSSEANRYIEAAVLSTNTYGSPYRYDTATAQNSATITIDNNSRTNSSNPLTIVPNTQYWYGAYATNTALSTSTVGGSFITLPAYITNVTVADDGHNNMTISVQHAAEGSADTAYTEYSYDRTNWVAVQDEFHLTVSSATTLYLRRENTTGTTPVYTVSIVPVTTVKLYGSVNNQAKEIHKLYGSVGGQSKRIRKLYGSVNGRSKLIYEDNS